MPWLPAFPEMSDRLRREADAFIKRVFPNSEEKVTTPPTVEGIDSSPNDRANA